MRAACSAQGRRCGRKCGGAVQRCGTGWFVLRPAFGTGGVVLSRGWWYRLRTPLCCTCTSRPSVFAPPRP
eukprot:3941277-Rhodomonas_salina.5